jgi:hypothetical protein
MDEPKNAQGRGWPKAGAARDGKATARKASSGRSASPDGATFQPAAAAPKGPTVTASSPVQALKSDMEREIALFERLGVDMDRLRDSYLSKRWTDSMTIAQGFESAAREIEEVDKDRDRSFSTLKNSLGAPADEPFTAVLMRMEARDRVALEESFRRLKSSVFRMKSASGRLTYCAETMADTLNRFLEGLFPHRRGKIYTRHGTPSQVVGALLIDKEL